MALAAAGWKITLSGRNIDRLEETRVMCSSQDVSIVAGDVRDEAHVKRLFEVTAEKYGALHRSRLTGSANKVDNMPC